MLGFIKHCQSCKAQMEPRDRYCAECGAKDIKQSIAFQIRCGTCTHELMPFQKHCMNCGAILSIKNTIIKVTSNSDQPIEGSSLIPFAHKTEFHRYTDRLGIPFYRSKSGELQIYDVDSPLFSGGNANIFRASFRNSDCVYRKGRDLASDIQTYKACWYYNEFGPSCNAIYLESETPGHVLGRASYDLNEGVTTLPHFQSNAVFIDEEHILHEQNKILNIARQMISLIFDFHDTTGEAHGDIKLYNFVYYYNEVHRAYQVGLIDFDNTKTYNRIFSPAYYGTEKCAPKDMKNTAAYFDRFALARCLIELCNPLSLYPTKESAYNPDTQYSYAEILCIILEGVHICSEDKHTHTGIKSMFRALKQILLTAHALAKDTECKYGVYDFFAILEEPVYPSD